MKAKYKCLNGFEELKDFIPCDERTPPHDSRCWNRAKFKSVKTGECLCALHAKRSGWCFRVT